MPRPDLNALPSPRVADRPPIHQIGDWLLRFGVGQPPSQGRTAAAWEQLAADAAWSVGIQRPHASWRGFPMRTLDVSAWRVWLLGELYGIEPAETTLARLFGRDDPGDACTLNGHFLLWAWNGRTRQWHVWTNRFGTLHAYRADNGRQRAWGTFSPSVSQWVSQRTLDWHGLLSFFACGYFAGDRTHFTDVKILRPAHHYVLDAHGVMVRQERYWQWRHEPDETLSYDDAVDRFGHLFQHVTDEHLGHGRTAIPVSGGLDSRSTVAAVRQPDGRLWCYSYGYDDRSIETRIARQVAAARRLDFQAYTIRPYLFERLPQVMAWTEGFQDITQCRQAAVAEDISAHADHLIAALWGDVWLDDMGLAEKDANLGGESQVIGHTLKRIEKVGRAWLLENLVSRQLGGEDCAAALRAIVAEEFSPLRHIEDPDFRIKAYKTDQWSFRWSLPPVRVFQSAAWPRPIFYDTRLTDFFGTIPTEFVRGRRLQIDYLKRFAPDLARVKWQARDANLYRYPRARRWSWPKRAARKVQRLVTGQRVIERNWEVQFLNAEGRQGLRSYLTKPGLRFHEFVAPNVINRLLDQFVSKPLTSAKPGYTVSMLLTFSAWLEQYG